MTDDSPIRVPLWKHLVPGLALLGLKRRGAGLVIFVAWVMYLLVLVFHGRGFARGLLGSSLDEAVAAGFLVIALAGCWGVSSWLIRRSVARENRTHAQAPSQWYQVYREFRKNRMALAGVLVLGFLYSTAFLCPFLARYAPDAMPDPIYGQYVAPSWVLQYRAWSQPGVCPISGDPTNPKYAPFAAGQYTRHTDHFLGTDELGRDIFSRVLYGSRISLTIGFIAVMLAITIGTLVGALAGYAGGWVDNLLMRVTDVFLSFPNIFLVLALIAILKERSIFLIIMVLGCTTWMGVARLVRGQILSLKEQDFIQAARALGASGRRIIFTHLIPNSMAPVIVAATLRVGSTILVEAALSYLGLGVPPPTPSWGSIVNEGKDVLLSAWWIASLPGLAIVMTVVSYNLVGDGLRDALDPRLRN